MRKVLFLLFVMIPALMWGTSVMPDPDYHLDVKFSTNGNALKGPFSWRKGDTMIVTTFKNDEASSPGAVIKNVHYYINGKFIGSVSKPFKFIYLLDELPIGYYKLFTRVDWEIDGFQFHSDFNWDLYIVDPIKDAKLLDFIGEQ